MVEIHFATHRRVAGLLRKNNASVGIGGPKRRLLFVASTSQCSWWPAHQNQDSTFSNYQTEIQESSPNSKSLRLEARGKPHSSFTKLAATSFVSNHASQGTTSRTGSEQP